MIGEFDQYFKNKCICDLVKWAEWLTDFFLVHKGDRLVKKIVI